MSRRGAVRRWQRRWKDGWVPAGLEGPGGRRNATIDMLVFDHGLLRKAWPNQHRVAEGVLRSNQPDPARIRRLAGQGVRAILNLRGATEYGSYLLEREACAAAGIELVDFKLSSRTLPTRDEILALDATFARLPKPFLMHCKSGADRAGFAAALYLLLQGDLPLAEAREQLSWRYLHLKSGATGILHFLLDRYEADSAETPMSFRTWIETRYDPVALTAEYRSNPVSDYLLDRVLKRE